MRLSITAPEITLIVVKLAASMSPCPNASRHNKELAANASIATVVSNTMFPAIDLKFPERIAATLVSIYDAYDSEENFHSLTPSGQPNRYTRITWFLDVLAHVNFCLRPLHALRHSVKPIMLDWLDISAMVNLYVSASQGTSIHHTVCGPASIYTGYGST